MTRDLRNHCSTTELNRQKQRKRKRKTHRRYTQEDYQQIVFGMDNEGYSFSLFVGVTGFEPAFSCSQSRRVSQTTLHPVKEAPPLRRVRMVRNLYPKGFYNQSCIYCKHDPKQIRSLKGCISILQQPISVLQVDYPHILCEFHHSTWGECKNLQRAL